MLNIQPKTYEYKDVRNRGTKRVYGFISQQIAEIIPEAVSTQKGTLYYIYSNFKSNGNIIHLKINDYDYHIIIIFLCHIIISIINFTFFCNTIQYIPYIISNIIVDKVIDGSDIFKNGKIVDDFNILDKKYIYA